MDLPLFPLHLVLFPGRPLPLHLFEPRYLQMLRDCVEGGGRFGVVAIRSGRESGRDWTAEDDLSAIHSVGTVAEIRTVAERPDGRFDIISRGCGRFRVLEPHHDRAYLCADVEVLEEDHGPAADEVAAEFRHTLVPYLQEMGVPDEFTSRLPDDAAELSYLAASALQVEVTVHQELLEMDSAVERMRAATKIIRRENRFMRHLGMVGSFRPIGPGGAQLN